MPEYFSAVKDCRIASRLAADTRLKRNKNGQSLSFHISLLAHLFLHVASILNVISAKYFRTLATCWKNFYHWANFFSGVTPKF